MDMNVNYRVSPLINQHTYKVELTFIPQNPSETLSLPTWIPGSYMIREFSKNIIGISAYQNHHNLPIIQTSKNSWEISELQVDTKVTITYEVYAYEYGIRTAFLDHRRGYFNPSSVCIAVDSLIDRTHEISFNNLPSNWQVVSGLENKEGVFIAENYDELLDMPFELGTFTKINFIIKNVPHYLILSGTILPFDEARIINDMNKICEYQINLFGGNVPYSHYTFILNLSGDIYTGLEHRNSTLLMAPSVSLPNLSGSNDEQYHKLMGLISHEFFHTWNVKRIKPQVFTPYNLNCENYTKLLWWFEGVTSYYDDLVLYRVGVIDQDKYLNTVLENINNVYKFAGVTKQTLANSSLTSWIKYYRQDENSPNIIVSYYVKGALVAMCLDLLIRDSSQFSLDTIMHYLYFEWVKNPVGVHEDEIPLIIKNATALDLSEFLNLATETCNPLPIKELFNKFGLGITDRIAKNHQANGIYREQKIETDNLITQTIDIGARLEKDALGYRVKNVYVGTSASDAGFAPGDLVIAINQIKLTNLELQLSFIQVGDIFECAILRGDRLINLKLTAATGGVKVYDAYLIDKTLLAKWL